MGRLPFFLSTIRPKLKPASAAIGTFHMWWPCHRKLSARLYARKKLSSIANDLNATLNSPLFLRESLKIMRRSGGRFRINKTEINSNNLILCEWGRFICWICDIWRSVGLVKRDFLIKICLENATFWGICSNPSSFDVTFWACARLDLFLEKG